VFPHRPSSQGHTRCAAFASAIFGLRDDDGHSVVLVDEVPQDQQDAALRAINACPERAISPQPVTQEVSSGE
jgi:ferredoxin